MSNIYSHLDTSEQETRAVHTSTGIPKGRLEWTYVVRDERGGRWRLTMGVDEYEGVVRVYAAEAIE